MTTFGPDDKFWLPYGSKIHIGKDCMLSCYIRFFCGDGHAIFDIPSGKRTLDITRDNPKNSIMLKDHVWVGLGAMILGNTVIERSSIVGAGSVVKGKFPNNCAIAGNPAKMVRENVTWSRNYYESEINRCGAENIRMTEHCTSRSAISAKAKISPLERRITAQMKRNSAHNRRR